MNDVLNVTSETLIPLDQGKQFIDQLINELQDLHGLEYLQTLCQKLSLSLGCDYVMINGHLDSSETMKTVCIYSHGKKGKNFIYDLECTPCLHVLENEICIVESDVITQFPEDHMLASEAIQSYAGRRIGNSAEDAIGVIVILCKKPLTNRLIIEYLFDRVFERVAAELIVHQYQQEAFSTHDVYKGNQDVHDLVRLLGLSLRSSESQLKSSLSGQKKQTELYGVLSHEIRNSLTGILSVAHLLGETELDSEQRHLLDIMFNAGCLIKDLMENMLDATSMHLGELGISKNHVDVQKLIKDCYSMFYTKQREDLELSVTTESLPQKVFTDGYRLQQVLLNLLGNAFKFTEKGKITLHVKGYELAGQPYIHVSVSDTGLGISGKYKLKLFEAFERGDTQVQNDSRGVGLGLYISNNIVQALGGKLSVETELGKGSTFSFSIPV